MRAVQVKQWGEAPAYVTVEDSPPTEADTDLLQLTVKAAGLHNLVKARAAGTHYSAKTLPHTCGVDGVGSSQDGNNYYFSLLSPSPGASPGSYSEKVNVSRSQAAQLPAGVDPVQIAGLMNPAMSSWMALTTRTTNLPPDFSVVIIGVTALSGRVAVHLARKLGAGRVIGVARNQAALEAVAGLDVRVPITTEEGDPSKSTTDFSAIPKDGVDVVLDYIYGPTFVGLFRHLTPTPARPLQYVEVGAMAARETNLPADLLRGKDITMRGTGPGAWSAQQFAEQLPRIVQALADVPAMPLKEYKLKDVAEGWASKERVVFTP